MLHISIKAPSYCAANHRRMPIILEVDQRKHPATLLTAIHTLRRSRPTFHLGGRRSAGRLDFLYLKARSLGSLRRRPDGIDIEFVVTTWTRRITCWCEYIQ